MDSSLYERLDGIYQKYSYFISSYPTHEHLTQFTTSTSASASLVLMQTNSGLLRYMYFDSALKSCTTLHLNVY